MVNEGNTIESRQQSSMMDQGTSQPQAQGPQLPAQPPVQPPPKPKWKPNTSRKRKRSTKNKMIAPPVKITEGGDSGSKKESWVWGHFTRYEENGELRAACNYCSQDYAAHPKLHGTGNLINHLQVLCKKYPYRLVDDKQKTLVFEAKDEFSSNLKLMCYTYEECRAKLVEMIIIDELPFKIVEGEGFKRFIASLQPKFIPPGRMTIARDCMKLYGDQMIKVKKLLKSERICLTTDTWTSIQNINYMCLTAHWIDKDWRLQKRILNFCVIANHKGVTISKMIENSLLAWGIDKILTVTVDNASSNDGALKYLKKNTKGWKSTIFDHEFLHLRCCAHILNLIVKDGLKNQNDSIVKIRNAVRYIRSSPARLNAFKTCVDVEKIESKSLLCLDIETRWNSTYMMLKTAVKFEKAFERLKEEDVNYQAYFVFGDKDNEEGVESLENEGDEKGKGKANHFGPPNEYDWSVAKSFVVFLKLFYDVTKKFSGSLSVTSNMFLQDLVNIQTTLKELLAQRDPNVRLMALNMQKKFTKYWESIDKLNFLLYVAAVLDPRYKMRFVRYCYNEVYERDSDLVNEREKHVRKLLVKLFDYYQSQSSCESTQNESSGSKQATNDIMNMDDNVDMSMSLAFKFAKQLEEEECGVTKTELTKYLEENCEKYVESFDILRWWKDNSARFPVLSQLAREVLAIPVSTVASESAFSTGGRILDPYRSSLNPEMVEALVCCQNWLRSTPITIDIQESMKEVTMDDVEKYEEVLREFRNPSAPSAKL